MFFPRPCRKGLQFFVRCYVGIIDELCDLCDRDDGGSTEHYNGLYIDSNSNEILNNFNNVTCVSNLVHDSFKKFATSDGINGSNNNNFNSGKVLKDFNSVSCLSNVTCDAFEGHSATDVFNGLKEKNCYYCSEFLKNFTYCENGGDMNGFNTCKDACFNSSENCTYNGGPLYKNKMTCTLTGPNVI
jgi:hypothetical protein